MNLKLIPKNLNKLVFFTLLIPSTVGYFIFTRLLQDYLNLTNDFVADVFPGHLILPEPLEIPLYYLGFLIIPVIARFLYFLYEKRVLKYLIWTGVIAIIVGIAVLWQKIVGKIPDPQFIINYFQTHTIGHALWLLFTKRLFVMMITTGLSLLIFFGLLFWKKPKNQWLKNIDKQKWLKYFVPIFFILLAVVVISPQFTYDEIHYNYIIGTVNDMLHGKPFLYETTNQYGILNVYLVATIFKFFPPISHAIASFFISVLFLIFFIAAFYFIRYWFNSYFWAYVGTLGSLALFYLGNSDPFYDAMRFPGPSAYRQGFFIIVALLLALYIHKKRTWLRELTLLGGALALFWNLDTGIYVAVALFAAMGYEQWVKGSSIKQKVAKVIGHGLHQLAYIILLFIFINLGNVLMYGSMPQWTLIVDAVAYYESGLGKLPLPQIGVFEVFVLMYISVLLWLFYKFTQRQPINIPLIFILLYGVFSFNYYLGNSAWSYLFAVSPPAIFLAVYLLKNYFDNNHEGDKNYKLVTASFYAFLFFITLLLIIKLPNEFYKRDYSDIPAKLAVVQAKDQELYADMLALKEKYDHLDRWPVYHLRDGKLLMLAEKTNYYWFYDKDNVNFKSQMNKIIEQTITERPPFIILSPEDDVRSNYLKQGIQDYYTKKESLQTLEIWTLNE